MVIEAVKPAREAYPNEDFEENYLVDHLAKILQEYGRILQLDVRLGVHEANGLSWIVYGGDAGPNATIIWIYNDDEQNERRSILGHYLGMKRRLSGLQDQSSWDLIAVETELRDSNPSRGGCSPECRLCSRDVK